MIRATEDWRYVAKCTLAALLIAALIFGALDLATSFSASPSHEERQ